MSETPYAAGKRAKWHSQSRGWLYGAIRDVNFETQVGQMVRDHSNEIESVPLRFLHPIPSYPVEDVIKVCLETRRGLTGLAPIHTCLAATYTPNVRTQPKFGLLFAFQNPPLSTWQHHHGFRYFLAHASVVGQANCSLQLGLIEPDHWTPPYRPRERFFQFWERREWAKPWDWFAGTEMELPGTVVCEWIEPFEELTLEGLRARHRILLPTV